jgi:sulfate transport system permease protein
MMLIGESALVRRLLIGVSVLFLGAFLLAPLAVVFAVAFGQGVVGYFASFRDPDTLSAIRLTLFAAAIAVPANLTFGVAAAWAIGKFEFWGKSLLIALIDLPFSVSPVVAGLTYVLLFGAQGILGPWLSAHNLHVIFAVPGIVLATIFVTFPFIARELLPLMAAQGNDEEEAAITLGASGWTDTMPLQIEVLYNDYQFVPAFAVASLLALLALVTLVVKSVVEWRAGKLGSQLA